MNAHLATGCLWSALLCAALPGCDATSSTGQTTLVPPTERVCPIEGMPFMVSQVVTSPQATLCIPPSSKKPFTMSAAYGNLHLANFLAGQEVDAQSFGLDWIATDVHGEYQRMLKPVSVPGDPAWEGWGAILYGDHQKIYAYAWGLPGKLPAVGLSAGHQLLHDMTPYNTEMIDAIDFNAWVFSGPPSSQCYAPHPPAPGQGYDPTLVYSLKGPPQGTSATVNNSGATLWGVRAVQTGGAWAWHGPFRVAEPEHIGLTVNQDIDTLAYDRRQGILMFSLTTTNLQVMLVEEEASGQGFGISVVSPPKDLETSDGTKFLNSGPLVSKPSTACAIDPSKFNWSGDRGDVPKKAARE